MTGGVTVPKSALNELKIKLAAAEQELTELRELRDKHYGGGQLPPELRQRARQLLMKIPGMSFVGKDNHTTVGGLLDVIEGMSKMLQLQFTRADQAEDELRSVNNMFAAVGELMHRASEAANTRRDRNGS